MTYHCYYCGWAGASDDRVPASSEWIASHGVDFDHFTNNGLNCPQCGESQFTTSGDDDVSDNDEFESDPVCSECGSKTFVCGDDLIVTCADCGYQDTDNSLGLAPDVSGLCPECGTEIQYINEDGSFTCHSCGYGDDI